MPTNGRQFLPVDLIVGTTRRSEEANERWDDESLNPTRSSEHLSEKLVRSGDPTGEREGEKRLNRGISEETIEQLHLFLHVDSHADILFGRLIESKIDLN
jgi:hypothetical protein